MPSKKTDISQPDFNFPQDVLRQASEQMKAAKVADTPDAQQFLNGLLKGLRASMQIDPENVEEQIKYIEENTAGIELSQPDSALLLALKAKILQRYYERHRWQLRDRDLPGDSISLWSSQQFNDTIADLYASAAELAANVDVAQYIPTVLTHGDTLIFNNFASVFAKWADVRQSFYEHCQPGSPAFFYWLAQEKMYSYENAAQCIDLYRQYSSHPWANMLLFELVHEANPGVYTPNTPENHYNAQRDSIVATIHEAVAAHPDFPYNSSLTAIADWLTTPAVRVEIKDYVPVGSPFSIIFSSYNARKVKVELCKATSRDFSNVKIANLKPIKIFEFLTDSVYDNQTFEYTLSEPGLYLLRSRVEGDKNYRATYFEATPFVPATLNSGSEAVALTADFVTGAPLAGVDVIGVADPNRNLARTDADGIARFAKWPNGNSWRHGLLFQYKGRNYSFGNQIDIRFDNASDSEPVHSVNVLTDRAIYHPGDELGWAVVFARKDVSGRKELMKKRALEVTLYDANNQKVASTKCTTDAMGRADGTFRIPADGLTGNFSVVAVYENMLGNITGRTRIMVSDFKAPVFEVKIDTLDMSPERVNIKGVATTYSGMPVADARVELEVAASYWVDKNIEYTARTVTDADGRFAFEVMADSVSNPDWSRVNIVVTNTAAQTAEITQVIRFAKQYVLEIDAPEGNVSSEKPLDFKVIAHDVNNRTTELAYKWKLMRGTEAVMQGEAKTGQSVTINAENLPASDYRIDVAPLDEAIADPAKSSGITLYNIAKNDVPSGSVIFLPVSTLQVSSDLRSASLTVGTPDPEAYVYVAVASEKGIHSVRNYKISRGYTTIDLPLGSDKDAKAKVISLKNGSTKVCNVSINRVEPRKLNIEVLSFRDRLIPGSTETWRMRIVGEGADSAAAVATMYNQALDRLTEYNSSLRFNLAGDSWRFGASTVSVGLGALNLESRLSYPKFPTFKVPVFNYLDNTTMIRGARMLKSNAVATMGLSEVAETEEDVAYDMEESVSFAAAPMAANAMMADAGFEMESAVENVPAPDPAYRDPEVLQAFWMPRLVADSAGVVTIEFTVPNANTTWAFHMFGWTADVLSARFDATALASRPVMVQSSVPRFLRQGDTATLSATVFNNTDSAATVATEFQVFNPADGTTITTLTDSVQLAPKASAVVTAPVAANPAMASVGYRVKAVAGTFADGEQDIIPILASSQMLVESKEFYLDAKGAPVTLRVPSANDATTTLQYCQNPIWTVVKAMRGVEWDNYNMTGAVATQLTSAVMARHIVGSNPRIASVLAQWKANPDSKALTSMLERNDDLKTLLINQTPWVQAAESNTARMDALARTLDSTRCDYVIAQSRKALEALQNPDGGFRWATWSDNQSSLWVTVNALQTIGVANSFGAYPGELSSIVRAAYRYVESAAVSDAKQTWLHLQYALIATQFPAITPSEAGKRLLHKTCAYLKKGWRNMDLSDKAYTALILNAHGYDADAREIVRSIEQYGKLTPDRGLEFPSVKDMRSYGNIIQAVAKVTPANPVINQMRQWVILQAQATDDLGACNPDYIIASVLLTGSIWADMTSVQPIAIDGKPAIFPEAELGTGYISTGVAPGAEIQIAPTGVTPSYGSVVSVFTAPMKDVPPFKTDDLEISKRMMVQRDGKWVESDTFNYGEEIQVQLQIRAKRQLEYVAITDERPAGFEPREQLPGWIWSNGIGFYRENRDASTRLFIGYLPKGSYSLTYTMAAATKGTFASGVATLQSQYDPALTAHTSGRQITIK